MAIAATAAATAAAASAAKAAAAVPTHAPPNRRAKRRTKALWWLFAGVLLLALTGAGATALVMKKRAAALAESDDTADAVAAAPQARRTDRRDPPLYVPLEPFVVNLADRDVDRFAQIGVTLQVEDARIAEELKLYLPAVRSGILMVLAHKTSKQLLDRQGKEQLVAEILREAVRPMGIHIDVPEAAEQAPLTTAVAAASATASATGSVSASAASAAPALAKKAASRRKPAVHNPVVAVNFSSFIIQ
jgi:flagellar protein FliL